jgi:hypothetical protein
MSLVNSRRIFFSFDLYIVNFFLNILCVKLINAFDECINFLLKFQWD